MRETSRPTEKKQMRCGTSSSISPFSRDGTWWELASFPSISSMTQRSSWIGHCFICGKTTGAWETRMKRNKVFSELISVLKWKHSKHIFLKQIGFKKWLPDTSSLQNIDCSKLLNTLKFHWTMIQQTIYFPFHRTQDIVLLPIDIIWELTRTRLCLTVHSFNFRPRIKPSCLHFLELLILWDTLLNL